MSKTKLSLKEAQELNLILMLESLGIRKINTNHPNFDYLWNHAENQGYLTNNGLSAEGVEQAGDVLYLSLKNQMRVLTNLLTRFNKLVREGKVAETDLLLDVIFLAQEFANSLESTQPTQFVQEVTSDYVAVVEEPLMEVSTNEVVEVVEVVETAKPKKAKKVKA